MSTDALCVLVRTSPLKLISKCGVQREEEGASGTRNLACQAGGQALLAEKMVGTALTEFEWSVDPRTGDWMNREWYCQMNFYLTRVMSDYSDYGCFSKYLQKMRIIDSSICSHCERMEDNDTQQILLKCDV